MAPSYTPHLGRILYPLLHTLMEPMRSRFRSEEHQKRSCAIQSVRPGQQQASSSCLPAEGFKMPALNRASILHPACSWQAGQSRQAAPMPWHPMPHCRLQVDGGNCSKKCFSTSLPPPVLEINIKIHFSPFIAVLKLTCTPDIINSPPHTILKRNNVKFYNSFSQWNISWTVSLKTNSDVHKQACLLWA